MTRLSTHCPFVYAGLFDNVLSDYLWARAVLLIGTVYNFPHLHWNCIKVEIAFLLAMQACEGLGCALIATSDLVIQLRW